MSALESVRGITSTAGAAMKRNSFESMSLEELWAIHEEIVSILEPKIETEKLKLERRLAELWLAPASELNGKRSARASVLSAL
jgi:hypothetical protein